MGEPRVDVRVLGPLVVESDGVPQRIGGQMPRRLLALLAAEAGTTQPTDSLISALWDEVAPATAGSALRVHVNTLRKRMPGVAGAIISEHGGYRLNLDEVRVDHRLFDQHLRDGYAGLDRDEPRALAALSGALALWRGAVFEDLDIPALAAWRAGLEAQRLDAATAFARLKLDTGSNDGLVEFLTPLATAHPEREQLTGHLMLALYREGRQSDALVAYQRLATWLRVELGLNPSPALVQLEEDIILQRPHLAGAAVHQRLPRAALPEIGLPPQLNRTAARPIFGRDELLDCFIDAFEAWDEQSWPAPAALVGEAGAGKTSALAAIASRAHERGVRVLFGWHSTNDLGPMRALTQALGGDDDPELTAAEDDPNGRATVIRRVSETLRSRAGDGRLLVVLDDCQWADSATMAIVEHVARSSPGTVAFLLAGRPASSGPWAELVAQQNGNLFAVHEVGALDLAAVHSWYSALVNRHHPGHHHQLEWAWRSTHGNAYLLEIVLSRLVANPAARLDLAASLDLPAAATATMALRLEGLTSATRRALARLAVVGLRVPQTLAASVVAQSGSDAGTVLQEAERSGVLVGADTAEGHVSFEHEILRSVLLADLNDRELVEIHRLSAETAAARGGSAADLAWHRCEALRLAQERADDDVADALESAAAAARNLVGASAWAEALRLARAALALVDADADVAPRRTLAELRLAVARSLQQLGERSDALDAYAEALDLALEAGDADLVGRVAVAASQWGQVLVLGDTIIGLLRRAHVMAADASISQRSRVLAELAIQHGSSLGFDRDLYDEITTALDSDDLELPASADLQRARLCLEAHDPDSGRRVQLAHQLIDSTRRDDALTSAHLEGLLWGVSAHLSRGEPGQAARLLDQLSSLATPTSHPNFAWLALTARADIEQHHGRLDSSDAVIRQALELGVSASIPDVMISYGAHVTTTSWLRGTLGDSADRIEAGIERAGTTPVALASSAVLGLAFASAQRRLDGEAVLDDAVERLRVAPPSLATAYTLSLLAQACLDLRVDRLAPTWLRLLRPWGGLWPRSALVGTSLGPTDRLLGALCALSGRHDEAQTLLRHALQQTLSAQSPIWRAVVHDEISLLGGPEADHHREAAELLADQHRIRLPSERRP